MSIQRKGLGNAKGVKHNTRFKIQSSGREIRCHCTFTGLRLLQHIRGMTPPNSNYRGEARTSPTNHVADEMNCRPLTRAKVVELHDMAVDASISLNAPRVAAEKAVVRSTKALPERGLALMLALKRTRTWRQGAQSPSPVAPVRVFGQPEAPRKPFRTARRSAQFGDEDLFTRGQKIWDRCHSTYGFCRSAHPIASSHSPSTRFDSIRHENGEESRRPIFDLSNAEPGKKSFVDGSPEPDMLLGGVIHSSSLACSPNREPSQWGWGLDLLSTPASDLRKQLAKDQTASILGVGADEVTGTSVHIQVVNQSCTNLSHPNQRSPSPRTPEGMRTPINGMDASVDSPHAVMSPLMPFLVSAGGMISPHMSPQMKDAALFAMSLCMPSGPRKPDSAPVTKTRTFNAKKRLLFANSKRLFS